jgi:hypothetical protein
VLGDIRRHVCRARRPSYTWYIDVDDLISDISDCGVARSCEYDANNACQAVEEEAAFERENYGNLRLIDTWGTQSSSVEMHFFAPRMSPAWNLVY